MIQLSLAPVHRDDPESSREAAVRVTPKVGTQLQRVLSAVFLNGPSGLSNREIQLVVCGANPGHPAWNKIPTRCRTLQRMGLLELVLKDGEPHLREHSDGGRFLTWRVA